MRKEDSALRFCVYEFFGAADDCPFAERLRISVIPPLGRSPPATNDLQSGAEVIFNFSSYNFHEPIEYSEKGG